MEIDKSLITPWFKPIGHTFACPNCVSKKTGYSCAENHQCWVCFNCGCVFSREEGQAAQDAHLEQRQVEQTLTRVANPLADLANAIERLKKYRGL